MILATTGIISSISGIVYDTDAAAFFARVTAAGGSLSLTEKSATNQLVLDLKANSLWTPMKAIYPMVGGGNADPAKAAAACSRNLKADEFNGTFTSTGWTFASTGVRPNGTSGYMDTFLAPNGNLSQNDAHASIYSRTNITNASQLDIGCGYTGNNTDFYLGAAYAGFGMISNINGSGGTIGATNTNSLGFFLSQRVSSTSTLMYQNNTQIHSTTAVSTTPSSLSINLGRNTNSEWSNRELAFVSFGSSFDATKRGALNSAVQAFQTTLSRNV
jgi:hypothetical protein